MTNIRGQIQSSIELLQHNIISCAIFPQLHDDREIIQRALTNLASGCEEADRPLRILLTGGTGVGKSSLLNALAGNSIAEAGARRPTTRSFTAYMNSEDRDDWLNILGNVTISLHAREELRGKILIDAPDADSVIDENRLLLEKAMEQADLILLVVTAEKYVSHAVMDVVRLYRTGRHFAYVFNKMDNGKDTSLINDFAQEIRKQMLPEGPIFAISARSVLLGDSSNPKIDPQSDFYRLEEFIGHQLTRVRIEEIKRVNLDQRAAQLARFIQSRLPPDFEESSTRWTEHCDAATSAYFVDIEQLVSESMISLEDVSKAVTRMRLSRFRGLFGLFSSIVLFLRGLADFRVKPLRFSGNTHILLTPVSTQHAQLISHRFNQLMDSWRLASHTSGMMPAFFTDFPDSESTLTGRRIPEWIQDHLMRHFNDALSQLGKPAGFFISMLSNSIPLAWIAYWLYAIVEAIVMRTHPPWESLSGALIILLAILGFQWVILDRLISMFSTRTARRCISLVFQNIRLDFISEFESAFNRKSTSIRQCVGNIQSALRGLK